MAYTSDETGAPEIFVQPLPTTGAKWQVSEGGGSDPHWRQGPLLFTSYTPTADGKRFLVNTLASDVAPLPIVVSTNWAVALKR